jgi:hypothetical protein
MSRFKLLIEDARDIELLTHFLQGPRNLSIVVDTDKKEIYFADEGQQVDFFMTGKLAEED